MMLHLPKYQPWWGREEQGWQGWAISAQCQQCGIPKARGRETIKTNVQGEEIKLNSKADNIRFKGRKRMGRCWEQEQTESGNKT